MRTTIQNVAALAVAALAALLGACGGSTPATISEYERWCNKDASDYEAGYLNDDATWGDYADLLQVFYDDEITPPDVQAYLQHYETRRALIKAVLDWANSRDSNMVVEERYFRAALADQARITELARAERDQRPADIDGCQAVV